MSRRIFVIIALMIAVLTLHTKAGSHGSNRSVEILGVHLGSAVDGAAAIVAQNVPGSNPRVHVGTLSMLGVTSPTMKFGADIWSADANNQVNLTYSLRPGVGIIAISRLQEFVNKTKPTIEALETQLINKYGEPDLRGKALNLAGTSSIMWNWTYDASVTPANIHTRVASFCDIALDKISSGEGVQFDMSRGAYGGYGLTIQGANLCGTWMRIYIAPDTIDPALVGGFQISIVDFKELVSSYSYSVDLLSQLAKKRNAKDAAEGAKASVPL